MLRYVPPTQNVNAHEIESSLHKRVYQYFLRVGFQLHTDPH